MSFRRITQRIGISSKHVEILASKNLDLVSEFITKSDLDLLQILNLPFEEIVQLRSQIQRKLMPTKLTLLGLLEESENQRMLSTKLPLLDHFLRGGIAPNCITEIVGAPGIGKTQFCHMLTALATLPTEFGGLLEDENCSVLYIDCENSFSSSRISELFFNLCPIDMKTNSHVENALNRVWTQSISKSEEFLQYLSILESVIIDKNIKFIVIDSIAALVRHEFDSSNMFKRQNLLNKEAAILKRLSESFHIPIVVTNQVASSSSNNQGSFNQQIRNSVAALGTGWYHCVNTRLTLEKCPAGDFEIPSNSVRAHIMASAPKGIQVGADTNLRSMTISKSPISPVVSFPYFITEAGLCLIKRLDFLVNKDTNMYNNQQNEDNKLEEYIYAFETANYWFNG